MDLPVCVDTLLVRRRTVVIRRRDALAHLQGPWTATSTLRDVRRQGLTLVGRRSIAERHLRPLLLQRARERNGRDVSREDITLVGHRSIAERPPRTQNQRGRRSLTRPISQGSGYKDAKGELVHSMHATGRADLICRIAARRSRDVDTSWNVRSPMLGEFGLRTQCTSSLRTSLVGRRSVVERRFHRSLSRAHAHVSRTRAIADGVRARCARRSLDVDTSWNDVLVVRSPIPHDLDRSQGTCSLPTSLAVYARTAYVARGTSIRCRTAFL